MESALLLDLGCLNVSQGGWIKLHRKIMESPIWSDPEMLRLWMLCMMKATHKPHQQAVGTQIVNLEPGQFVTGRDALADEYNRKLRNKDADSVQPRTLWRWMKALETWGNLSIKSTNKYSVVTVVNWAFYQSEDGMFGQQNVQQMSSKCPTDVQQMSTNKNLRIKEIKEDREIETPLGEFASIYQEIFGLEISQREVESLNSYLDDEGMELALLTYGLEMSKDYNPGSFKYVEKIYNKWIRMGVKTLEEWKQHEKSQNEKIRQFPQKSKEVLYSSEELGGW